MLISVVTPVLNGAKTVERTLKSLAVQQAQFEHVVMDGGSKDDTEAIVRRYEGVYPVRFEQQADRSVFEGMWNGMERAKGDVMGTIFADDFYLPWTLANVSRIFEAHPEVQWITGIPSWYFEETGLQFTGTFAPVYLRSRIAAGWQSSRRFGFLQQESIFWRRSLWERERPEVERILKSYRYAADFHLWRIFARHAELRTVSSVLACFTISNNQISGKFRSKYLEECGIQGDTFDVPPAWKMINRLIAFALFRRVLKPCLVQR